MRWPDISLPPINLWVMPNFSKGQKKPRHKTRSEVRGDKHKK